MSKMNLSDLLTNFAVCFEAVEWSKSYGDDYDKAYQECPRGEWLLWLLGCNKGLDHKKIVKICCKIARLVVHNNPDPRIIKCIETVERWLENKATKEEVLEARKGAYASIVIYDSPQAYTAATAGCAAYATDINYITQSCKACPSHAAYAVDVPIRKQIRKQIADIIREEYPSPFELYDFITR